MNAGLLDMLHDRPDHSRLAVADAIDIDFDCVFEKTIHQDRSIRPYFDRALHVSAKIFLVINQLHGTPAKDEGRP